MKREYDLLEKSLIALDVVCDGALSDDGCGFNGTDSKFGKSLARQLKDGKYLTWKQRTAAHKMLRKYSKTQLPGFGIKFEKIEIKQERPALPKQNINRKVTLEKGFWVFESEYNPDIINEIKTFTGRYYSGKTRRWGIPITNPVNKVKAFADKYNFSYKQNIWGKGKPVKKQKLIIPSNIPLRDFQRKGVEFLVNTERVLLSDEMGLGKTIQTLTAIKTLEAYPCIIVCPASLKINWKNEIEKWLGQHTIEIVSGRNYTFQIKNPDFIIINYDILSHNLDNIIKLKPIAMVLDESHYIKQSKTLRSKACKKLSNLVKYKYLLTGTPILNRPIELTHQLEVLGYLKPMFGGFMPFAKRYCNAFKNHFGWDFTGSSNLPELNAKLKPMMKRRLKKDVLSELPAKQVIPITVEITNRSEYDTARNDFLDWLEENLGEEKAEKATRAEQLVKIEVLKQLSAKGKMKNMIAWINDFLESGEKLVVFATHIDVQKSLLNEFVDSARIFGKDDNTTRQKNVDRFQNGPSCQLMISSLKAGGVGITLTASSNVLFVEFGWNPSDMIQAEDRLHRIGQKDSVNCYYMVGENTIDISILELIESKRAVIDNTIDGKVNTGNDDSILDQLLGKIK